MPSNLARVWVCVWVIVLLWVCVWVVFIVSYALHLLIFGSCYTAHERIVNIMKVYIKRTTYKWN